MKVEIIGKFFDLHSLSIVNRNLAIHSHELLKKEGIELYITPLDDYDAVHKVDKKQVKLLK